MRTLTTVWLSKGNKSTDPRATHVGKRGKIRWSNGNVTEEWIAGCGVGRNPEALKYRLDSSPVEVTCRRCRSMFDLDS